MKIDNFALTMHQTCPTKHDFRMRSGWTTRYKSAALWFGGVMHAGFAEWYRTHDLDLALEAIDKAANAEVYTPGDDYRTLQKAKDVMRDYVREYPDEPWKVLDLGNRKFVEEHFTLMTGYFLPCEDHFFETIDKPTEDRCFCGKDREPLEYGGIFDGIIEFSGSLYVLEHKTTSQLGSYYFNQFKPNNQVSGYVWAASLMSGVQIDGALINAIGAYKVGATKFARTITSRNAFEIEESMLNVYRECCNIKLHEMAGHWPKRTQSCTLYGLCEFHSVCSINAPEHRQRRLEQDYVKSHWDYERRDE